MEQLLQYFPHLTDEQKQQFTELGPLYTEWNEKINVISRKDIDSIYVHHILHALALSKIMSFQPNTKILDFGTGGGFPGIPLAILFPEVEFTLVDSIGKKIKVVTEIAEALQLKNVIAIQDRVENIKDKFDFITCRGVAPLEQLFRWTTKNVSGKHKHAYPNGMFFYKGGNVKDEIKALPGKQYTEVFPIRDFFSDPFFEEKVIVYIQG